MSGKEGLRVTSDEKGAGSPLAVALVITRTPSGAAVPDFYNRRSSLLPHCLRAGSPGVWCVFSRVLDGVMLSCPRGDLARES